MSRAAGRFFPFALRFLFASCPEALARVLEVIYRLLATHLAHQAGFTRKEAATGVVTLVQRIAERVDGALERMGILARDADAAWLDLPPAEDADAMTQLIGSSVTYRLALGPQAGRKALMLRTITPLAGEDPTNERVAKAYGFSLHAGVGCEAHQRALRERLCRYIARLAVAEPAVRALPRYRFRCSTRRPRRAGSLALAVDESFRNRLLFAHPDGTLAYYDKRHLFRMAGEHHSYAAGSERFVVDWNGWRIRLQVCYDLRFPVWSRNRGDYDALLYVANWPARRREHWRALLLDAGDTAGVHHAVLGTDTLANCRAKFPVHLDADGPTMIADQSSIAATFPLARRTRAPLA